MGRGGQTRGQRGVNLGVRGSETGSNQGAVRILCILLSRVKRNLGWYFGTIHGEPTPRRNWVVVSARQATKASSESIPGRLKGLKIPFLHSTDRLLNDEI
jgi:hypothetical protein